MLKRNLAHRIVIFSLLGMILFSLAVVFSVDYVRRGMNAQAAEDTLRIASDRMSTLHDQVRLMARDYNNWGDVYTAAKDTNIGFIADNYGITAINGDIFDGVVMFDGFFRTPIAWTKGQAREPSPSFLSQQTLSYIRQNIEHLDVSKRQTFDFVQNDEGQLSFLSASYLLPDTKEALGRAEFDPRTIAVISRKLRDAEMASIRSDLSLSRLKMSVQPDSQLQNLPLNGVDGQPEIFISWTPPKPGDRMIAKIAPIGAVISLTILALTALGTYLLTVNAKDLMARGQDAMRAARSDLLTGLPNRLALIEHIGRISRKPNSRFALILFDINGFKSVNDVIGHQGGDAVIQILAQRLRAIFNESIVICRVGGDEFVSVVHYDDDLRQRVLEVACQIKTALFEQVDFAGNRFHLTASFGFAIRTSSGETCEELLFQADHAMYDAKSSKADQPREYSNEMHLKWKMERRIELALREAITRREEFHIRYQPIIDAKSLRLVRVEALARWTSATMGDISPDIFIAVAERTALMDQLGLLIFEKVCEEVSGFSSLNVSINVSPNQLLSGEFASRIRDLARRFQVSPQRIQLELTEGIAIQNTDAVKSRLTEIGLIGFTTALDDFGSGFSSIGYLRQMPFDCLKIDKSLMSSDSGINGIDEVVKPIIALGHSLGKLVTAEGVETHEDMARLQEAGVDMMQGYFFGMPQTLRDLMTLYPLEVSLKAA